MRVRALVTGLVLCLGLSGCAATSALSTAAGLVGGKPDVTAQVGAENTKQGIGLSGKLDSSNETTVRDSNVGALDSSKGKAEKAQNISTGSITADRIEVKNGDTSAMILAFLAGLLPILIIEGVVWYFVRKLRRTPDTVETK